MARSNQRDVPTEVELPRTLSRDTRRMVNHIGEKEFRRPGGWADNRERKYLAQPHPPTQQRGFKRRSIIHIIPNFIQGSRLIIKRRCQNIEHSSFPQICDAVFRQLKEFGPWLQRELPYPVFLHGMNTVLQAWLIDTARNVNQETRWQDEDQPLSAIPREMIVPRPIAEYLAMINTNVTPNGDTIRINIPDVTIPVDGADPSIPAGSFGPADAEAHNSYEVNISPFVTMRNIRSCTSDVQLSPLYEHLHPANTTPTDNLLGYVPRVQYSIESRSMMEGYRFADGERLAGRLCLCPALMADVSATLHRLDTKFKMVRVSEISRGPNLACSVYNDYQVMRFGENCNVGAIAEQTPVISALFSFGATTASQAAVFGFKKK